MANYKDKMQIQEDNDKQKRDNKLRSKEKKKATNYN